MKNTMKNTIRLLILATILALVPQGLHAQNSLTQTIISAAITAGATSMRVASATNFTASTGQITRWAYLDRELVRIRTVSGTTIGIDRGAMGTVASSHAANAVVFTYDTGTRSDPWQSRTYTGSCTRTLQTVQPIINVLTGDIQDCDANLGLWESVNLTQSLANYPYRSVTNAAYTAGLYDSVIQMILTGTNRTLTLPAVTGVHGKPVIVRQDGPGTLTIQGSNSQGVGTSTEGLTQSLAGGGVAMRLVSVGGSWVTW